MDTVKPSVRVLIRPPHSPATTASAPSQTSMTPPVPFSDRPSAISSSSAAPSSFSSVATSSKSQTRSSEGVVVVGFIGRRPDNCSQIINSVIDSNVFGSGNLDKNLCIEKEEVMNWFERRKISYYHDDEKGILFLQLCSTSCPAIDGFSEPSPGFDSLAEEHEFGYLQGMLFMFSVCHVIIYMQEGSHLDPRILKNLRVVQAAKHALAPFVKSLITPHLSSKRRSSSSGRPSSSATSPNNVSPGRGGSARGHNTSAISLMSGLGSYASLFPGQCTPVTLFVFIDDFFDSPNLATNSEDLGDVSSSNHSSNPSSLSKSNMLLKGSGSVVVLARPASRSEGGFRKKLQSSLEAKIRFLIKKCLMSGSEVSHSGPRSRGGSPSAPLFSLDASRAVVLLDRSSIQKGESLEHATGLLEYILNGKTILESLLLESHGQGPRKEDIISVKDFIYRQSDILRGKGGLVNSNSGSAAGVGMVAVAAAAAAASVASRKMFTSPDLPNMDVWLSSGCLILQGILSAKGEGRDEFEFIKRRPRSRNFQPPAVDGSSKGDPVEIGVFWLRSGRGLNLKFSTSWCERALPAAKEIYLKDLPACYPTSQHEINLEKAMHAFYGMVKGPAVALYVKKLEDECTSIWKSGRQLCDAISLTGKPCMHQIHLIEAGESDLRITAKPHSSDFFFLHACACGCSRQLRPDPFDFESVNSNSICFQDCDKLLPSLKLPEISIAGHIQPSSWSLLRLGSSEFYDPSKGLLQSGFCGTQKFLSRWVIYLENYKDTDGIAVNMVQQGSEIRPSNVVSAGTNMKSTVTAQPYARVLLNGEKDQKTSFDKQFSDDKKINFGRGLPNFRLKKPFSEVVAGSASSDSAFPPLQHIKASSSGSDMTTKHSRARDKSIEQTHVTIDDQGPQKSEDTSFVKGPANNSSDNNWRDSDPFLQIGSNVVPVNSNVRLMKSPSSINVTAYVGFEHECPYGHRFLLNSEHLNELGPTYALLEESQLSLSVDNLDYVSENIKVNKNARRGKIHRNSNGMIATPMNKERNMSRDIIADGNSYSDELVSSKNPNLGKNLRGNLQSRAINEDEGHTFSLLSRNLPIYMNCPHCRLSKNKRDAPNVKFAGTVSQLQRIIMVTPPLPVVLETCPVVHFEPTCLPPSVPDHERKLQFSLGCQVILPPESFLTLRLPFVYGVRLEDNSLHPLSPFEHRPEMTAWIANGTSFQILSKGDQLCRYEAR